MILEVERGWGRPPGWFATQSQDVQRHLYAWYLWREQRRELEAERQAHLVAKAIAPLFGKRPR